MVNFMSVGKITSLVGLKVLFLFGIFIWHTNLPKSGIDLGARCCEFFFVVSGFLVAYNFHRKNSNLAPSPWGYFKRKLFQLYPLHIITFLISLIFLDKFSSTKAFFNIALLQSWTIDKPIFFGYNGVSWFLSSILFCYLIAPLLMSYIQVFNVKKTIKFLLCLCLLRFFIEYLPTTTHFSLWHIQYHVSPLIRGLEFFVGMQLLPIFLHLKEFFVQEKCIKWYFTFAEIAMVVLLYFLWEYTKFVRGAYIIFIVLLVLLIALNLGYVSKVLSNRLFIILSNIEYEFFMIHQIVIRMFAKYFKNTLNIYEYNLIILLVTIAICYCYKFIYPIFAKFITIFINRIKTSL